MTRTRSLLRLGGAGALAFAALTPTLSASQGALALRVGRAETISQGTLEHAVILVENGEIVVVGEDLPIERGIPVLDLPDTVVTPGLVSCHTRLGLEGRGGRGFDPHLRAADELPVREPVWDDLLEAGITTLGLYPSGSGIPGQAAAIRPRGERAEDRVLSRSAYLLIHLVSSATSKKMLRDAFEKADEYEEKVAKEREKWDKEQEKKKKKKKSKKDDDEDDKKKEKEEEDEGPQHFVPSPPDEEVVPIRALRAKELAALMSLRKSSDYLHLLDVIEDEDLDYALHVPLRDDIDLYEIAERVGEAGQRIVLTARITLAPNTRRERNVPAEFARAGAKLALLPKVDSLASHEEWIHDVGHLVAAGLDRQAALAAMTLEPACVLGLGDSLGSLEAGKTANLVLWDGDPFEPGTRIQAVMLEGEFVTGEVTR